MTLADTLRAALTDAQFGDAQHFLPVEIDRIIAAVLPLPTAERKKVETMRKALFLQRDRYDFHDAAWMAADESLVKFEAIFGPAPETATEGK